MLMLEHVHQPVEDLGQGAGGFAGLQHAAVKRREDLRVLPEGVIQVGAVADVLVDGGEDRLQMLVFALLLQHLEQGEHGHAGADEGFELFGEQDQFRRFDRRKKLENPGFFRAGAAPRTCMGIKPREARAAEAACTDSASISPFDAAPVSLMAW